MRLKMPSAESFDRTESETSETLLACCHINLDDKAQFSSSWLAISTAALYAGKVALLRHNIELKNAKSSHNIAGHYKKIFN